MHNEKVIFRAENNPFRPDAESYLAVFPETEGWRGYMLALPFFFDAAGNAWFEAHAEIDGAYYYGKTRCVHTGTPQAVKCLAAVERFYNEKFDVRERR